MRGKVDLKKKGQHLRCKAAVKMLVWIAKTMDRCIEMNRRYIKSIDEEVLNVCLSLLRDDQLLKNLGRERELAQSSVKEKKSRA